MMEAEVWSGRARGGNTKSARLLRRTWRQAPARVSRGARPPKWCRGNSCCARHRVVRWCPHGPRARPPCTARTRRPLTLLRVSPFAVHCDTAISLHPLCGKRPTWIIGKQLKMKGGRITPLQDHLFFNNRSDTWKGKDVKLFPNVILVITTGSKCYITLSTVLLLLFVAFRAKPALLSVTSSNMFHYSACS